ncbi:MAG: hypothetical protein U0P30_10195 [Vicinamibacterales bacterium]
MSAPGFRVRRLDDTLPGVSNTDVQLAVVLVIAAGIVLYAIGRPFVFNMNSPDFNPLIVFSAVLLAVAAFYAVRGVRRKAASNRFGQTYMELQGDDVLVGETLRGRVFTSRPLKADDGFRFTLRCIERKGESFDETRRRTQDAILWEATQTVRSGDSSAGVPVEILVPPAAIANAKFARQDWSLIVEATVGGSMFMATFMAPVITGPRDPDDYDDDRGLPDEDEDDGAEGAKPGA